MISNRRWWQRIFTETFASKLSASNAAVIQRLLPTFERIEEEAEAFSNEVFRQLGQHLVSEDSYMDMVDAAEQAQDEGRAHYGRITGVRQGLLNLATAGVYHLFEQQVA